MAAPQRHTHPTKQGAPRQTADERKRRSDRGRTNVHGATASKQRDRGLTASSHLHKLVKAASGGSEVCRRRRFGKRAQMLNYATLFLIVPIINNPP